MIREVNVKILCFDVLRYIYHDLFQGEYNRITLFAQDKDAPEFIKPFVRYRPHDANLEEAESSHAHYRKGEGYTGCAWRIPHQHFAAPFPPFETREKFEDYYANILEVPKGMAAEISSYMEKVRVIYCHGFLDRNGNCTAVLSIDCLDPFVGTEEQCVELFAEKFALNRTLIFLDVLLDSLREFFSN